MNFTIFTNISRLFNRNLNVLKFQQLSSVKIFCRIQPRVSDGRTRFNSRKIVCNIDDDSNWKHRWKRASTIAGGTLVSAAFSFNFFGKKEEDQETPEDKLINAIKRSILCIHREQFDKAEQMLHLALRMAQDLQSYEGITYVYDVMANLAMEREQYPKAEKLFADVMRRLLADGHGEDSPQILHISSKLAHMSQLQGDLDKSLQGFTWTIKRIEDSLKKMPNDREIQELLGLTKNWFGQLLIKLGKYAEAKLLFEEAYKCLTDIYGSVNEEAITILNNLSVACVNLEDFELAKRYLLEALELVSDMKDSSQEGILQANLGLIYLREGLISQAKDTCSLAWRTGKKNNNLDAIEQAEYCLNEIKSHTQ